MSKKKQVDIIKEANPIVEALVPRKHWRWAVVWISNCGEIYPNCKNMVDPHNGGFVMTDISFTTKQLAKDYIANRLSDDEIDEHEAKHLHIVKIAYVL